MKILLIFFSALLLITNTFSQNVNNVNKTLNTLNKKTKPNIKFSLKKNLLIINVYKNTTHLRQDKIYIDDLDVNGVFYDKSNKQITLKCINEYCVSRKIFVNGDKKVAKSSSFIVCNDDNKNQEVVLLIKKLITDINNDKIKVVNNTVEKQVSDLGNNMVSVNVVDLGFKTFNINYDRFFYDNKFSFEIPFSFGFSEKLIQSGVAIKYFFHKGEARYYSFGNINLKQSQVSYFIAPNALFGSDKFGLFTRYYGEIGVILQMANGFNVSASGYIGGVNYLKTTTQPSNNFYVDYNIKICVGYRF